MQTRNGQKAQSSDQGVVAVIRIKNDGSVRCLWTDAIDLSRLGDLRVSRASTVEFNARLQQWEVRLPGRKAPLCRSVNREACLAFERLFFFNKLEEEGEI